MGRRDFIRALAGTAALAGITGPFDYLKAQIANGEKGLYITSIYRISRVVRIETNKGIVGYGECRDVDSYATSMLETLAPHLVGMNPTKIEDIYNTMVQLWSLEDIYNSSPYASGGDMMRFQSHMGTGAISGIEMACWDIVGKVYNVPLYKLLGPRLRDKIPLYADTSATFGDEDMASAVEERVELGFKYFKADMYLMYIAEDCVTASSKLNEYGYYDNTISQTGLDLMGEYMEKYRNELEKNSEPYASAPVGSDHYQGYLTGIEGQLSVESAIALAEVLKVHNGGGFVEDVIDWWIDGCSGRPGKAVNDGTDVPVLTGEDMFGFDQLKTLADIGAIDYFHPEPNTFGGINQTMLAVNYADSKGIKTYFHNSSGPIAMACYAHIAAATPGFVAMEYHHVGSTAHDILIDGVEKPMLQEGCTQVPEGPGLGVEPNKVQFSKYYGTWTKLT